MTRRPRITWDAVTWSLVAVVLVGSAIRFAGIAWGMPLQLHGDEWVVVEGAIDMARRNSFEPGYFFRPDHLEIQLSYLAYQVYAHVFHSATPEALFAVDQNPFYVLSRGIIAFLGSAMIPVAYLIGRGFSRPAGLFMAGAVAFFPPFVEHSRYVTPDIPLTLCCMILILGCVRYLRGGRWVDLVIAAFGVAWGFTAKYPAALGVVVIAAAVVIGAVQRRRPWEILTRGAASAAMVVAMIFLISPVLFTNASEVKAQLTAQNGNDVLGQDGLGWGGNLAFYARQALDNGGVILLVFAIAGAVWLVRHRRWDGVPLVTGLVFWIGISALRLHWDRWALPMYLTPVLLAGIGVVAAWRFAARVLPQRRIGQWIVGVVAGLSGLALIAGSSAQLVSALTPDTRVRALSEVAALGVTPDNTYVDGYTPFAPRIAETLMRDLTVSDGKVVALKPDSAHRFVMTSAGMSGRFLADPAKGEGYRLYTAIQDTLPVVRTWPTAGGPPTGMWEVPRLIATAQYFGRLAGGASVGPTLTLYRFDG